jgi:hypothetical protein
VWRAAWAVDVVEKRTGPYEIRVEAIDDLLRAATPEQRPLLHAVRDELDRR